MIDTDSDDHIDRSCWLPPGEPIITAQRASKGDMRIERRDDGEINYARAHIRNILNYLWQSEIITADQHDAAWTFKAWREQHQLSLGLLRHSDGADGTPDSFGVKLRAHGYILIVRRLSVDDCVTINNAIDTTQDAHSRFLAARYKKNYERAMQNLENVLVPVRERISALESLSEEDRNEVEDKALRNFLDEVVRNR